MQEQAEGMLPVKRRRHLDEHSWRALFDRFAQAGLTVEEFCRREGVCRSSFRRWRTRLLGAPRKGPAAAPKTPPPGPAFVDLGAIGGSAARAFELSLELGDGIRLRLVRG
ncbi:IS66 family insertion sequence element accessory protein TnpA [Thiomonas sp.]|uniref:ORFA of ISCARN15, IS66 family n=1 Tax=mine drainage metagenome TaxID=410659 RepID=E6PJH8_9ZZZZ